MHCNFLITYCSTQEARSVREFVEESFKFIGVTIVWEGEGVNETGRDAATGIVRVRVSERVRTCTREHRLYYPTLIFCNGAVLPAC